MNIKPEIKEVMDNLEKNNMQAIYAEKKEDVPEIIKSLLKSGDTVSVGGSVTLAQCKVIDLLKSGEYNYLDRNDKSLDRAGVEDVFRRSFFADAYITGTNAVTRDGRLYNVDGNGNRVSAICFGPKSVIVVVGANKIVDGIAEAQQRVKTVAAPKNCVRLCKKTYCAETGVCAACDEDFDGCSSPDRICRSYMVTAKQGVKNRIKVIIANESLGY